MKILVTGAAGLYGSHLTRLLLSKPEVEAVWAIDDFSRPFLQPDPLETIVSDPKLRLQKRDYRGLTHEEIDEWNPCAFVHFAAKVSIDESMIRPQAYFETNESGTFRLCRTLLQSHSRPLLIYASSPEVYGNPRYVPMDEDHPLNPRSVYAATKLAAEKHCRVLHDWYGYPVIVIRNFNTFGPNQHSGAHSAVIPKFIARALRGENLQIHGSGQQTRDFLYVKDAVLAYWLALNGGKSLAGLVANIGTGREVSVADLASTVRRLTGSSSSASAGPGRSADLERLAADTTAAKTHLGWNSEYSLEDGLTETIDWYRRWLF